MTYKFHLSILYGFHEWSCNVWMPQHFVFFSVHDDLNILLKSTPLLPTDPDNFINYCITLCRRTGHTTCSVRGFLFLYCYLFYNELEYFVTTGKFEWKKQREDQMINTWMSARHSHKNTYLTWDSGDCLRWCIKKAPNLISMAHDGAIIHRNETNCGIAARPKGNEI